MKKKNPLIPAILLLSLLAVLAALPALRAGTSPSTQAGVPAQPAAPAAAVELPVHRLPNLGEAAEWYFSRTGKYLVGNAKGPGDTAHQVYISSFDGLDIRRINDKGEDACSFFFPDGKRVLWTSTRDWPDLPKGNWSDANDYPQGAEIYSSDTQGGHVRRLTNNQVYDAECVVAPNGRWILFS